MMIGVPPLGAFQPILNNGYFEEVKTRVDLIISQMYQQAIINLENEKMPIFQDKIDNREAVAQNIEDEYPELADKIFDYVEDKRIELKLDDFLAN